jgi:hypothetical protein
MNFRSLNLIWNWIELTRLRKEKWHCCVGLGPLWFSGWPSSDFSTHLAFRTRSQSRGGHQASSGGSGRPNPGDCRRQGVAGRVQGASWQGSALDLGRWRAGGSAEWLVHGGVDALPYSTNSQILHAARLEYSKQLSKLFRLQIPNRFHVKNPETGSIFESSMNFKKGSNILEKSDKFSKLSSWLYIHKSEFSWAHLYVRIWVTTQVSKRIGLNKKKRVWI